MTALIAARDLRLSYGRRTVIDGLDVRVEAGEVFALVGRSGSGKTSLLLCLAGLIPPSAGSVRIADRRAVAYVPQAPSLVPELTALENVVLAARLRGRDPAAAHERAMAELGTLGLAEAAEALPHELSGGMAARVSLARALTLDPHVLLVDEPTGSLDRATGSRVLDLLMQRSDGGTALLVATHDPHVAERLGRTVHLDSGRSEVPA